MFLVENRRIVTITCIVEVVGTRTIEGMLEEVLNVWKHLKGFTLKLFLIQWRKVCIYKDLDFFQNLKGKLKFGNIRDSH